MSGKTSKPYNKLNPVEIAVIEHKATEPPFTGEYYLHFEKGTYHCKKCNQALFLSAHKFDSDCGWPSFDDAIEGAVKRIPDADGRRTEILCANCGGHLGHVFEGEGYTDKNIRHCVNSISLTFSPEETKKENKNRAVAIYAGGCFWGLDYYFRKAEGVKKVEAGYCGGHTTNPSYEDVCSGTTGHYEVVRVEYDPSLTDYEELTKLFFELHDPTQTNGQGPDIGTQYRSAIFCENKHQKEVARRLIKVLEDKGLKVATEIKDAGTFWIAEDYHQNYYEIRGGMPYCHSRTSRFD